MKKINKNVFCWMLVLMLGAWAHAEDIPALVSVDSLDTDSAGTGSKGFYLAMPAYLYAVNSTFGLQAGYQFEKVHIRLDMNFAENCLHDEDVWIFMPSVASSVS